MAARQQVPIEMLELPVPLDARALTEGSWSEPHILVVDEKVRAPPKKKKKYIIKQILMQQEF
jgi:hypothetical protein